MARRAAAPRAYGKALRKLLGAPGGGINRGVALDLERDGLVVITGPAPEPGDGNGWVPGKAWKQGRGCLLARLAPAGVEAARLAASGQSPYASSGRLDPNYWDVLVRTYASARGT